MSPEPTLGLLVGPYTSENFDSKVQTRNANLKPAKSMFVTAFVKMRTNEFLRISKNGKIREFLRILKRYATNSQSMNAVVAYRTIL